MSDTNYKKTTKLVRAIVIMLIAGSLLGFARTRLHGKNDLVVHFQKTVHLTEDIYIEHPEHQISGYYDSDEHGEEGDPLLIPAGTEGSIDENFWYYGIYYSNGGYNEFIRNEDDSLTVVFHLEEGRIKVRFTDEPAESYRTYDVTRYDVDGGKRTVAFTDLTEEFDSAKLESYDTTLEEINKAKNEYHFKWVSREITGAVIGLVISLVFAGIIMLIRKKSLEVTIDSTLLGIIIAIDVILIIACAFNFYAFPRLA